MEKNLTNNLLLFRSRYAESRIRTHEGTKPIGPKPIPFGHSGISANVMSVRYQKLASQYLRIIEIDLFAV